MNGGDQNFQSSESSDKLQQYIKDALDSGANLDEIVKVLIESGWPMEKIKEALLTFYTSYYPSQSMPNQQYSGYIPPPPQFQDYLQQPGGTYFKGYAGFWIRFLANFIDFTILQIAFLTLRMILFRSIKIQIYSIASLRKALVELLIQVIIYILYFAFMESSRHQGTVGKIACSLKVTDLNGQRVSFDKAIARVVAKYFISGILTLGIGDIIIAFDEKKQGLHDKIAGTLVLKK